MVDFLFRDENLLIKDAARMILKSNKLIHKLMNKKQMNLLDPRKLQGSTRTLTFDLTYKLFSIAHECPFHKLYSRDNVRARNFKLFRLSFLPSFEIVILEGSIEFEKGISTFESFQRNATLTRKSLSLRLKLSALYKKNRKQVVLFFQLLHFF